MGEFQVLIIEEHVPEKIEMYAIPQNLMIAAELTKFASMHTEDMSEEQHEKLAELLEEARKKSVPVCSGSGHTYGLYVREVCHFEFIM